MFAHCLVSGILICEPKKCMQVVEVKMTANIDILQTALASAGDTSSSTVLNQFAASPVPGLPTINQQQRAASMSNLVSSIHSPPPLSALNTNSMPLQGAGLAYPQWTATAKAPLLPLGYGQCFQQTALPLQPMRTPTTRGYPSTASVTLPSLPTPPPTPASGNLVGNLPRFQFPPLQPDYNLALATAAAPPPIDNANHGQIFLPIPPSVSAVKTPSPTPPPTSSPGSQCPTDTISHSLFENYLYQTWPEDSVRRASSTIRSSLYDKIVAVLQGGDTNGRQKKWIEKSEFFLVEKEGRGLLLAVPLLKSRTSKRGASETGGGKSESRGSSYKLVAKLEDFYYIISSYHNNNIGHHGIRKTYGMIQDDYSYLPRMAVAKYIDLCNICKIHRTGKTNTTQKGRKRATKPNTASKNAPTTDKENSVPSFETLLKDS